MQQGIGIIDSGVGGLTVVKEVIRQLPREKIIYFGDTARCPYGPRPPEEVRKFTFQMVEYLMNYQIKALVIACNTATAVAMQDVVREISIPVIGVIEPGSRTAIKETRTHRVGVIGTTGTIQSGAYENTLKRINPGIEVYSLACPRLVPLVESGDLTSQHTKKVVNESLAPLSDENIDTLILGCTHYPLIADAIQEAVGPGVSLISSADETARELSAVLSYRNMLAEQNGIESPEHRFFTSGSPQAFQKMAEQWLAIPVQVSQVDLETVSNRSTF